LLKGLTARLHTLCRSTSIKRPNGTIQNGILICGAGVSPARHRRDACTIIPANQRINRQKYANAGSPRNRPFAGAKAGLASQRLFPRKSRSFFRRLGRSSGFRIKLALHLPAADLVVPCSIALLGQIALLSQIERGAGELPTVV